MEADTTAAKSNETYIPLSRGLKEHLRELSGNETKIYIWLLLSAQFTGKDKGKTTGSARDIAKELGISKNTVISSLHELRKSGYIRFKEGENQFKKTEFTIEKYKGVEDFASNHKFKNGVPKIGTPCTKNWDSTVKNRDSTFCKSNNDKENGTPKNDIRMNKNVFKNNFNKIEPKMKILLKNNVNSIK